MVFTHKSTDFSTTFEGIPGYVLRRLKSPDIQAFIDLGLPTCAFMHGRPNLPLSKMRQSFAGFVREHAFSDDSEIYILDGPSQSHIAQLWLHHTRNRFNGLRELWVWDVTVATAFRHKGIGKQLIEFAKRRAEELSVEELWLLVSSVNDVAIELYRSCGLRDLGQLLCFPIDHPSREPQIVTLRTAVLRPLTGEHPPEALHKLWTAADLPFRPLGRDSLNRLRASLNRAHDGGWGAFSGGQLIGAALASYDGRRGWIERMAVLPDHRRAGLAKALIAACMNSLRERGALVIGAMIDEENSASRLLFESCGFVHKSDICYYTFRESNDC